MFLWKKNNSLAIRITAFSLVIFLLLIMVVGLILMEVFGKSLDDTLLSGITANMKVIIAATIVGESGDITLSHTELLNKLPNSWQVTAKDGKKVAKSDSLPEWIETDFSSFEDMALLNLAGQNNYIVKKTIIRNKAGEITYAIAVPRLKIDLYKKEENYKYLLITAVIIGVLGIFLVLTSYFLLRISISPLDNVRKALKKVRSGDKKNIEGDYPFEINPLIEEMNLLINYTTGIVERHKVFSGNLAHALGTPVYFLYNKAKLEITKNESNKDLTAFAEIVRDKSEAITKIIERQLHKARTTGTANVIGAKTHCLPVIEEIVENYSSVYDKLVEVNCDKTVYFHGDKDDFYELISNIIENACKYCVSKVNISVSADKKVIVIVEDDGSGVAEEKQKEILERGVKLDETVDGSGLGLAISRDIVVLYGGSLEFDNSDLGGLKVIITLPLRIHDK